MSTKLRQTGDNTWEIPGGKVTHEDRKFKVEAFGTEQIYENRDKSDPPPEGAIDLEDLIHLYSNPPRCKEHRNKYDTGNATHSSIRCSECGCVMPIQQAIQEMKDSDELW